MNKPLSIGLILTVLLIPGVRLWAETDAVIQAFDQLRAFQSGGDPQPFKTIEAAVVRSYSDSSLRGVLLEQFETLLAPSVCFETRRFACCQLALIATGKQIPALIPLLREETMADLALYALERIPGSAVDEALVEALAELPNGQKQSVIYTLGQRRSPLAINPLGTLLTDADPAIAGEAVMALGRIGTPAASQILLTALSQADPPAKNTLTRAGLHCAEQLIANGQSGAATEIYNKVYQSSFTPATDRSAALKGLWRAHVPTAYADVIESLQSSDRTMRLMAIHIIHDCATAEETGRLAGMTEQLPLEARVHFLRALPERPAPALLPMLRQALADTDPDLKLAALQALAGSSDMASFPLLIRHVSSENEACRQAARDGLIKLSGSAVSSAILAEIPNVKPEIQVILIQILDERQAFETANQLLRYASSSNPQVKSAAQKALRSLADPEVIDPLINLLVNSSPSDVAPLRSIFSAIARRNDSYQMITKSLLDHLDSIDQPARRIPVLQVLGDMGLPEALPALTTALHDADPGLGYAALTALGGWVDASPLNDLLEVARNHALPTHRVLALRAYIRLVDNASSLSPDEKLADLHTALSLHPSDQEKKAILGVIAKLPTLAALELARNSLDRESVQSEAALAVIQIARSIYLKFPDVAGTALNQVLQTQVSSPLQDQARAVLGDIEKIQSYLTDWEVAGPYFVENKTCQELFDIAFAPELPDTPVTWQPMPVSQLNTHPAYLDLLAALQGGEQRVAYLRTHIRVQDDKTARLEIYSDDGVKAWLNGMPIHANNTLRPILDQPDLVDISLHRGDNILLLKVTQNNMPWGAIVRLVDPK